MFVGVVIVTGDAGFHYVLLIDADTDSPPQQYEVSAFNGSYTYNFASVAEGNYFIFAGTDSDNDIFIGDAGESIGAYISLDQPTVISVNQDLSNIDFNTSFKLNLPTDLSNDNGISGSGMRRMETK